MRGRRGRPPKAQLMQEPSPAPARGLRPRRGLRAKGRGSDEVDFESPKRGNYHSPRGSKRKVGSTTASRGGRGRGRGGGRGRGRGRARRSPASLIVYDDHESEDEDAESLRSDEEDFVEEEHLSDEEEEAAEEESDCLEEIPEEEDDDASYCTEGSSHGSAQGNTSGQIHLQDDPCFCLKQHLGSLW